MDLHNHSLFSADSKTPMEENIKEAINSGLKYISVTEHLGIFQEDEDYTKELDIDGYMKEVDRLRAIYSKDILILKGVELSLQEDTKRIYEDILKDKNYDFIIGSSHGAKGLDFVADGVYTKYSIDDFYKYYYEQVQKSVENNCDFDVLGHLDYMDRYFPKKSEIPPIERYFEYIKPIFKLLISRNQGIEINTGGLRRGLKEFHPKIEALRLYKNMGGKIITLGSDAHFSKDIGYNIGKSINILKDEGFKKVYIFEKRKPLEIDI